MATREDESVGSGPDHYTQLVRWLGGEDAARAKGLFPVNLGTGYEIRWDIIFGQDGPPKTLGKEASGGQAAMSELVRELNRKMYRGFIWSAVEVRLYKENQDAARMSREGMPAFPSHWFNREDSVVPMLDPAAFKDLTLVTFEGLFHEKIEGCYVLRNDERRKNTISVPYPTAFHAASDDVLEEHIQWVKTSPRDKLIAYYASPHGRGEELRGRIAEQCASAPDACLDMSAPSPDLDAAFQPSSNRTRTNREVHDALRSAKFCLQPAGDTPTRSQIFECLICGGIPVFFSTCAQADLVYERLYEPFLPPFERTSFGPGPWAVVLDQNKVISQSDYLLETLRTIASDTLRITKMQQTIISFLPRLQYPPDPTVPPDLPRFGPDALGVYAGLLDERLAANANGAQGGDGHENEDASLSAVGGVQPKGRLVG